MLGRVLAQKKRPVVRIALSDDEDEFPPIEDVFAKFNLTRPPPTAIPPSTSETRPTAQRQSTTAARKPASVKPPPRPTAAARSTTAPSAPPAPPSRPPPDELHSVAPPTPTSLSFSPRPASPRPRKTATKPKTLAEDLFPSPPRASTSNRPLDSIENDLDLGWPADEGRDTPASRRARSDRSASIISDSEPESFLPPPRTRTIGEGFGGKSAREERQPEKGKGRRESSIVEDSEDERERERLANGASNAFSYDFEDDFESDGILIFEPSTPQPESSRPPKSSRAARRLTIITVDLGSDSDSDAGPSLSTPKPKTKPSSSKPQHSPHQRTAHSVCADSDSDELDIGNETIALSDSPEREASWIGDVSLNPNDGVLSYVPSPRSSKPTRLLPPSFSLTPAATPTRPLAKKRPLVVDLTLSDSDSDAPSAGPSRAPSLFFSLTTPGRTNLPASSSSATPRPRPPPTCLARPKPSSSTSLPPPTLSKPRTTTPSPTPVRKPPRVAFLPTPSSSSAVRPQQANPTKLLTAAERESLPLALIRELDRSVFRRKWDGLRCLEEGTAAGLPDGLTVVWNKRLLNTAGRASWKKITQGGKVTHQTAIDLAVKVTDTEDKLRQTLAHELCHIAAWVLSGEIKPSHGRAFKLWAKRISQKRPDIVITTTHSYKISYKFNWKCNQTTCGKTFGRHSNSIDSNLHGCPCGGRLVAVDANGAVKAVRATPAKKSLYQVFVSEVAPRVKAANPGLPQAQVFKICAEKWREKAGKGKGKAQDSDEDDSDDDDGLLARMRRLGV